jgi:hypothetical protein
LYGNVWHFSFVFEVVNLLVFVCGCLELLFDVYEMKLVVMFFVFGKFF